MKIDIIQGLPVECPENVAILRFNTVAEKKEFLRFLNSFAFRQQFELFQGETTLNAKRSRNLVEPIKSI